MSSSLFRQIEAGDRGGEHRAEGLFKAAVSAFCSLPRPSRHDIQQLDVLASPLFDRVSPGAKRFASAALSECAAAPPELLDRLCESGLDVAAPLLIRSAALSDAKLVSLIARHGRPYAQAVARRHNLHPAIRHLLRALGASHEAVRAKPAPPDPLPLAPSPPDTAAPAPKARSEESARTALRAMMRPAASTRTLGGRTAFLRLRDAALTRQSALFATALADSLGIWFDQAAAIATDPGEHALALRALGLKEEEALLLLALTLPHAFTGAEDTVRFLDHYAGLAGEAVETALRRWRAPDSAGAGAVPKRFMAR